MTQTTTSSPKNASGTPLPHVIRPANLTWKAVVCLAALVTVALFFEAYLHYRVVLPYLADKFGQESVKHGGSDPTLGLQILGGMVIAPLFEEMIFRLPFAFGFVNLINTARKAKSQGDKRIFRDALGTISAFLVCSLFFIFINSLGGSHSILYSEMVAYGIALFLFYRWYSEKPLHKIYVIMLGAVSTITFAVAHLNRYEMYPNNLYAGLLVIPQLFSGFIYLYAASKYNLSVSMTCHMITNGLLLFPPFVKLLSAV